MDKITAMENAFRKILYGRGSLSGRIMTTVEDEGVDIETIA